MQKLAIHPRTAHFVGVIYPFISLQQKVRIILTLKFWRIVHNFPVYLLAFFYLYLVCLCDKYGGCIMVLLLDKTPPGCFGMSQYNPSFTSSIVTI